MKNKTASAVKFVRCHKKSLAVGTVAVTVIVLQHRGIKHMSNFLAEKGLYEEYFTPDYDA